MMFIYFAALILSPMAVASQIPLAVEDETCFIQKDMKLKGKEISESVASSEVATHNKLDLVLIDMFILPGFFGMDRFYMGSIVLGLLKLCMGLSTIIIGTLAGFAERLNMKGAVGWLAGSTGILLSISGLWAVLDIFIVLHNGLDKSTTISTFGFSGDFGDQHIETAYRLSFIGVIALLFVIGYPMITMVTAVFTSLMPKQQEGSKSAASQQAIMYIKKEASQQSQQQSQQQGGSKSAAGGGSRGGGKTSIEDRRRGQELEDNTRDNSWARTEDGTPLLSLPAEHSKEQLIRAFARIDVNGNGVISRAELIKACRQDAEVRVLLGLPQFIHQEDGTRDVFERVFQDIDTDESKGINKEEFSAYMLGRRQSSPARARACTED